ncbi:MAG: hypothetical protein J0M16_00220 [Gammaproteobacteria bacterium]|nr:hypothetical protein [Gammaproteobacteria bacterium]
MPDSHTDPGPNSILAGVDDLIDSALCVIDIGEPPHHKHGKSCRRLTKTPVSGFDASALLEDAYQTVRNNWDASNYHQRSEENWRFTKQERISAENSSSEVCLERAIVSIPEDIWADAENWVNQVPVASGLVDPQADGSRRIDLVHKCGNKAYEFIELKTANYTPLYAAMEIVKYGVLYIFCREDARTQDWIYRERELLQAEKIHLRVLAPANYYEGYDLAWLEASINRGVVKFLAQYKFTMDFKFEALPLIPSRSPVRWKVRT